MHGAGFGNINAQTHGLTKTPEHRAWIEARRRCFTPTAHNYGSYGGRGITMCQEWREDFTVFLRDMGPKPSTAHTLERCDVNGNYDPSNCVWATRAEQARNRRTTRYVEYASRKMSLAEACELAAVPYATIKSRIDRMGLTFDAAVLYVRPPGSGRRAAW